VPSFEKEPEEIIDGFHELIIDVNLFYRVQEVLNNNCMKRNRAKQKSTREELPLRGLLHCSNCGHKVTGSASRSKTGAKHYDYHCNLCRKERYKAALPNECIENFLGELKLINSAQFVYNDMIAILLKEKAQARLTINVASVKSKIQLLSNRIDKLQDFLVDDIISADEYQKKKSQYQTELKGLNESIKDNSLEEFGVKKKDS
jgi:site-specific DNA recombinase